MLSDALIVRAAGIAARAERCRCAIAEPICRETLLAVGRDRARVDFQSLYPEEARVEREVCRLLGELDELVRRIEMGLDPKVRSLYDVRAAWRSIPRVVGGRATPRDDERIVARIPGAHGVEVVDVDGGLYDAELASVRAARRRYCVRGGR